MSKLLMLCGLGLVLGLTLQSAVSNPSATDQQKLLARGRHLVMTSGCNDCHTENYGDSGGRLPENQWLMGNHVGWHGPWGTTYPVNLRLVVHNLTGQQWIKQLRNTQTRPPMPWYFFRSMSDRDLMAIYQFTRSLGPVGDPAPAYLPPGQKPKPPHFELVLPPAPAAVADH